MFIHQDGRYLPYNIDMIDKEDISNPWCQSIQGNNYTQNESISHINGNTTSYSLHPENQEKVILHGLPFVQVGENLWDSNLLNEKQSFNEEFGKEFRILQSQMPNENTTTVIDYNIIDNDESTHKSIILNDDSNASILPKSQEYVGISIINNYIDVQANDKINENKSIDEINKNIEIASNESLLENPFIEFEDLESQTNVVSKVFDESSFENPSLNNKDLQSKTNATLNVIEANLNEQSNIGSSSNDLQSLEILEERQLDKINSASNPHSQLPMVFYACKQNYPSPNSKWIQKLIIIPPQSHGYHDITLVVTIFNNKPL